MRPDEVSFAPKDSIKAELTQSIAKQGSAGNNTSDEAFQGADTTDATPAKQAQSTESNKVEESRDNDPMEEVEAPAAVQISQPQIADNRDTDEQEEAKEEDPAAQNRSLPGGGES